MQPAIATGAGAAPEAGAAVCTAFTSLPAAGYRKTAMAATLSCERQSL